MSYATVNSCTLCGVHAVPVIVEVHTCGGLPGMSIVGLPQSAVRESKDRVRAAIQHIGLKYPQVKIIVNLAPADLPKRGARFDLPIALGILLATEQLPANSLEGLLVLGELGLTGELRAVSGILPAAYALLDKQLALYIPVSNASEALRCSAIRVHAASSLHEAVGQLRQRSSIPLLAIAPMLASAMPKTLETGQRNWRFDLTSPVAHQNSQKPDNPAPQITAVPRMTITEVHHPYTNAMDLRRSSLPDMADVFGQQKARRALEIAAAGAHHLLMTGPPGTGKSMLARRLPGIQPPMSEREAMESACIASVSHAGFDESRWGIRPFRAPHHTASGVALVGGGMQPMPGEISLAHHGVLFLDELTEFSRSVLDVLREPMETGYITVSRAARQAEFPSRFQLIGAMNPCPCGYYNDKKIVCRCSPDMILRYQSRVSGPFLDRIDLHLTLQREVPATGALGAVADNEASAPIRRRVILARERQLERQSQVNSVLDQAELRRYAGLDQYALTLLEQARQALDLSLRAQHRMLRVARTIADLAGCTVIEYEHLAESLSYRRSPALNVSGGMDCTTRETR